MWGGEERVHATMGKRVGVTSLLGPWGHGDQIQVVRLGGNLLSPPSQLTVPTYNLMYNLGLRVLFQSPLTSLPGLPHVILPALLSMYLLYPFTEGYRSEITPRLHLSCLVIQSPAQVQVLGTNFHLFVFQLAHVLRL